MPDLPDQRRPLIVINADDLGMSADVNEAIVSTLLDGLTTSATIMTNMPGFDGACAAITLNGLQDRIGVHLNLSQGQSLTEAIRSCPRLCSPSGQLIRRHRSLWRFDQGERQAVEEELTAQIEALLGKGIRPSHFDSHHHVHTQWPVGTIVVRLAKRYGVSAVRLSRNCGPRAGPAARVYKAGFNARLARSGLAKTRYFGSADAALSIGPTADPVEIMVHPGLDAAGRVVDIGLDTPPLADVAGHWRAAGTLVSYRALMDQRR